MTKYQSFCVVTVSVAITAMVGWGIAYGSFYMGYRDGLVHRQKLLQSEIDNQCAMWWTGEDMAATRKRFCKGNPDAASKN